MPLSPRRRAGKTLGLLTFKLSLNSDKRHPEPNLPLDSRTTGCENVACLKSMDGIDSRLHGNDMSIGFIKTFQGSIFVAII